MIPIYGAISVESWDTFHATAPIQNLAINDHQHHQDHVTVGNAVVAGIAILLEDVLNLDQEKGAGHDQDHKLAFSRASLSGIPNSSTNSNMTIWTQFYSLERSV